MTPLHGPPSLRDFLDGGGDFTGMSRLEWLGEAAIERRLRLNEPERAHFAGVMLDQVEEQLADPEQLKVSHNPQDELTMGLWGAQVLVDDDLAERVVSLLPAVLVRFSMAAVEAETRPYVITHEVQIFTC